MALSSQTHDLKRRDDGFFSLSHRKHGVRVRGRSSRSADREHRVSHDPWRPSSPLCSDLGFRCTHLTASQIPLPLPAMAGCECSYVSMLWRPLSLVDTAHAEANVLLSRIEHDTISRRKPATRLAQRREV